MPIKSIAQLHKLYALEKEGKLKRGTARKWVKETKNLSKLPQRKK